MIRWKYAAPRLIIVLAVCLFAWFGLDPLLHCTLCRVGQSMTGAKVDIGGVDTSVLRTKICVRDLQVADPRSTGKNLFQAERLVLDFDTAALLHRKYVVQEGRISGLRINTARERSGDLDSADEDKHESSSLAQAGLSWLEEFGRRLGEDPEGKLETVRVAKELMDRWPREYKQLEQRTAALKQRVDRLRDLIDNRQLDALRDLSKVQQALADMDSLRSDASDLRRELERLRMQVPRDREALMAAKENDERMIRELFELRSLDAETWSKYLLGSQQGEQFSQWIAWLQWARQYIPTKAAPTKPNRTGGLYVLFPGVRQTPDYLIRKLVIDGEAALNGQSMLITGTATDLTSQPKLHGQPAVISLTSSGQAEMSIDAIVDRTGDKSRDRITIRCPSLPQGERVLGRREQLAIIVPSGSIRLDVVLELVDDALAGSIQLQQPTGQLQTTVDGKYGGAAVASRLNDALQDVQTLDLFVDVSGTLRRPSWKLSSNVGSELSAGLNRVFQNELAARREQLIAQVEDYRKVQSADLRNFVDAKQQELLDKLQLAEADVASVKERVAGRIGVPDSPILRDLPVGRFFRR